MAGEGSIYRSGEWWIAQIEAPGSSRAYRRYRRRKRRLRSEARVALDELRAERRDGVTPSRVTVGAFLESWVETVRNLRPSSRIGYANAIRYHWLDEIGAIRLAELAPYDVERALARLAPRMSPKYLATIHAVLRKALNDARRLGLVSRNVASRDYVDAPRVPDREPEAFSADEVARLLEIADGVVGAALRISVGTGLRPGELLGLAWEDVDLDGRRLHVRRALKRRDGAYYREELKTGTRSRRVLPIAGELLVVFREQEARVRRLGFLPVATGPVFVNRSGGPLSGAWLCHKLYELEAAAGVRRLPWKNLRTTFASRLFEAGVPDRTIADWLGHRRTTMTHGHYIDTADASQERALAAVGGLLR